MTTCSETQMIRPARLVIIFTILFLSACQSNAPAKPGVVISPETQSQAIDTASPQQNFPGDSFTVISAQTTGNLQNPELTEVSGLALSTRQSNTLWAINDSGNAAKLFAFNHKGESLGSWKVNAENRDWEDLSSAWINGESYLFIADIGDNLRIKDEHKVIVITEPVLDNNPGAPLEPIHTIRFRYPGKTHNAEALAVDGESMYVLTKEPLLNGERQASHVYRIPISLAGETQTVNAELIATLAIPSGSIESSIIASLGGVDVSQPTAFDIHQQNRTAYILTYRSVYRYERKQNQSWAQVLAQPRKKVHTHSLSQAEALAVGDNGVVWFTSEKRPAPLWALPGD